MIMNLKMLNTAACILLLAPWNAAAQNVRSSPEYRVRSPARNRDLQQVQFNPLDMMLSYSDDGAVREDEFYLDIFDTPEILTNSQSPMAISSAMNSFLLAELNSKFDELNAVENVASEIVHLKTRNGTYVNASGFEDSRIGTEARMKVILTFEQTPSPKTEDVEIVLRWIMSDLSYFVTNLTSSVSDENELKDVYVAIRREIRPILLVQPPDQNIIVDITEEINQGGNSGNASKKMLFSTVPALVAVAILVAVVVFFVFKKRDKPREPESVKDSEMMYDVENEVFSMDRSVQSAETRSPTSKVEPMQMPDELSSIQYSVSADSGLLTENHAGCDSIFSGIDTEMTSVLSPRSISSPKSMLTGFTCASASTIRASNTEHNKRKKKKSPVGGNSVFAFLDPIEDGDEESAEDDFELNERAQPTKNQVPKEPEEDLTGSSSSSSLEGVSINLPVKSKEEDQDILADLADLENMETTIAAPRDPTPSNMALRVEAKNGIEATPRNNDAPATDEKNQTGANKTSNFMGGFFKGKRKNESPPPASPTKKTTSTPPDSPLQQVGRHWITSSGKKTTRRVPTSPKMDVDYDMMLSQQPSPTGGFDDSREFNDSINDTMRIVDKAPQDLDSDHSARRRHAGDKIGGDGSALYQASAMKPTDWSVKSSDAGSVGSSALDSESGQNQPGQNQKSVSASRQLISDLVWLEQKISNVRGGTKLTRSTPAMESDDSVMYDSRNRQSELSANYSSASEKDPSNIVCRDCYAPPGKLNIVIHSTKDGPAVHTVKDGSSLEGEIYPGDLIISVDNLDTRTCTAEEIMNMMASKGDQERKITVLRFLEEA